VQQLNVPTVDRGVQIKERKPLKAPQHENKNTKRSQLEFHFYSESNSRHETEINKSEQKSFISEKN
jgi:hypothetical protein